MGMSFLKFGALVKARREELGLTQEDLATKVQLSPESIYKLESGRVKDIKAGHLYDIADALKWTPDQTYKAYRGRNPYTTNEDKRLRAIQIAYNEFIQRIREIETL